MPVVGLWPDYQDVFARGNGECMMKKLRSQRVLIRDETLIEQFALLLFTCAALALYSDCNARGLSKCHLSQCLRSLRSD